MAFRKVLSSLKKSTFHRVQNDWQSSYRFFGGVAALFRAVSGTCLIRTGKYKRQSKLKNSVECITFSVIPGMTALWATIFQNSMRAHSILTSIGDCSGGLNGWTPLLGSENMQIIPMLNYVHGDKLDLFFQKVCTSPYVIVSDDDVFWLSDEPLLWALKALKENEETAVVSLMPRSRTSDVLNGQVDVPMGSYCLVIKRDVWLREKLSFSIVDNEDTRTRQWFYDTADFAQVELQRRGYKVKIAPHNVRDHLVSFEAISSWGQSIRRHDGDLNKRAQNISLRWQKASTAVGVLEKMVEMIEENGLEKCWPSFLPLNSLILARQQSESYFSMQTHQYNDAGLTQSIHRLESRLRDVMSHDISLGS